MFILLQNIHVKMFTRKSKDQTKATTDFFWTRSLSGSCLVSYFHVFFREYQYYLAWFAEKCKQMNNKLYSSHTNHRPKVLVEVGSGKRYFGCNWFFFIIVFKYIVCPCHPECHEKCFLIGPYWQHNIIYLCLPKQSQITAEHELSFMMSEL